MSRITLVAALVITLAGGGLVAAPSAVADAATTSADGASTRTGGASDAAAGLADAPAVQQGFASSGQEARTQVAAHEDDRVCSDPAPGEAACMLEVTPGAAVPTTDPGDAAGAATAAPSMAASAAASVAGLQPADLRSAYALPATGGSGATIALISAYDAPNVEADLTTYRAQFGMTPCTTANGCFRKLSQAGSATALPDANAGWARESTADVEMASAICPQCSLLLVEADTTRLADLGTAVKAAVAAGAKYVSNSYGSPISAGTDASGWDNAYYRQPGVVMTAASGDGGYGTSYPATSPWVTAVGGTTLSYSSTTGTWSETAWSGAGSGCGTYGGKPAWQTDAGCARRSTTDVSAVAAGIAVYLEGTDGQATWTTAGGTSLSAPIIAATYALAGTPRSGTYPSQYPYQHVSALNDIRSGSNGSCATAAAYLCTAGAGYDGPTGLGTPHGVAAFRPGPLVTRIAGTNAYDTAAKTAEAGGYSTDIPVAYVAARSGFADALSGGAAAGRDGAPILLVTRDSVPSQTSAALQTLRPQRIVVLGGPAVVDDAVIAALRPLATSGETPVRYAGATRWETSAAVSQHAFANGAETVYITTGTNFPDALAGAAVAANAAHSGPVLLVPGTSIPTVVRQELTRLQRLGSYRIVVLGGTNAVSAGVAEQLGSWSSRVDRLSGSNRYATSVAVSRATYPDGAASVYIATGADFPDALAGAPVAGRLGAPVLLVTPGSTPAVVQAEIDRLGATSVVVLGGTDAVGASAAATL